MKTRTVGLFSAALLLSTSSLLHADPIVLDAVYDPMDSVNLSVSLSFPRPSLIGYMIPINTTGRLVQADLLLGVGGESPEAATGDVFVLPVTAGVPALDPSQALAHATLPMIRRGGLTSAEFVPVQFDSGAPVSAGQQVAVVVQMRSGFVSWLGHADDPYPFGAHLFRILGTPEHCSTGDCGWTISPGDDMGFRSYISVSSASPTPEPTTLLLLGSGLVVAGARRFRRA